jgi:hypothetical protein
MQKLSERLSKKTGLSIIECESMVAAIAEELIETLRTDPKVVFNKLGIVFRTDNVDGRRLTVVLDKPVQERLMKPTGEIVDNEIIFK